MVAMPQRQEPKDPDSTWLPTLVLGLLMMSTLLVAIIILFFFHTK